MADKNRARELARVSNDYEGFMAMVNERAEEARRQGPSDTITERVALATSKHLAVLDRIQDRVPESAAEAVNRARIASLERQKNALRALAKARPERALDISQAAIEKRLNRASLKATENITAEVETALEGAADLAEIEDEISETASKLGTDNATIARRIARAWPSAFGAVTVRLPSEEMPQPRSTA